MNLNPSIQLDDIYQIENLDYVTANLANIQPQGLLNRLSYVYYYKDIDIDNEKYADDLIVDGLWDDDDVIEQDIAEVEAQSDVVDIVGTYAALQQYDTSDLTVNDVIKVLADENYDNLSTYYKWNGTSFIYQSYERKSIPVILTQNAQITPVHDAVYIINGNSPDIEIIPSVNMSTGMCITFVAVQNFHLEWTSIGGSHHEYNILAGNSAQIYFDGDSFIWWKDDVLDSIYPVGTVIFSTLSTQPSVGGTWELLHEGYVLCPDTVDIGIGQNLSNNRSITPSSTTGNTNGTSITVAMLPAHTHSMSGSLTSGGSHYHNFYGTTTSKINWNHNNSSSTGYYKTQSATSNAGSVAHTHSVTLALGNSSQYTNATATAHTHSFTGEEVTINIMQASYALYAWKRTA